MYKKWEKIEKPALYILVALLTLTGALLYRDNKTELRESDRIIAELKIENLGLEARLGAIRNTIAGVGTEIGAASDTASGIAAGIGDAAGNAEEISGGIGDIGDGISRIITELEGLIEVIDRITAIIGADSPPAP